MIAPRDWPTAAVTVARTFGARGAALRVAHELRRRAGAFRAAPRHEVMLAPLSSHPFRVDAAALTAATDWTAALARAERVARGEYQAYRDAWRALPASPAEWLVNPDTGHRYAADAAWWHTPHLDRSAGDIKHAWEPARFGWAYDLVRGYLLSGDDRFAAAFHHRLAEWSASSAPFRGVHWSCGQETAIRAIALLYAEANLVGAPSTTAEAQDRLGGLLAASGERIADAIGYAVSQRNNHAISEAVGLVVLGARFAGMHPEAARWLREGHDLLDRLVREQFAADGWYVQHSFTYLRVALDQCVIAARALRSARRRLSEAAAARLRAAAELLLAVMAGPSGDVPNHGANDGAFVHPITLAAYRDFRPVVTAVAATFDVAMPADVSVDREVLAWLGRRAPAATTARADGVRSGASGWAAARVGGTAVFLRAGRYRSRPSHLDPLHLDVRLDETPFVVDAGTFAYQSAAPWRNGLATARVHNGPLLDDAEPGIRGPRFLWFAWPAADLLEVREEPGRGLVRLVAEVPGRVRRTVCVTAEGAIVDDEVLDDAARSMRVAWLLHPRAEATKLSCSIPHRTIAADERHVLAWYSPHYGERLPSIACVAELAATRGARLRTWLGIVPDANARQLAGQRAQPALPSTRT